MFQKKVTLSKTFTDEPSYNHFKKMYDSCTVAFENVWHCESQDTAQPTEAPAVEPVAPAESVPVEAPAETAPEPTEAPIQQAA